MSDSDIVKMLLMAQRDALLKARDVLANKVAGLNIAIETLVSGIEAESPSPPNASPAAPPRSE